MSRLFVNTRIACFGRFGRFGAKQVKRAIQVKQAKQAKREDGTGDGEEW
jgi:hypothetical protein